MVTFHGERLHGRYVLFRTRGDDWMIHRMDPPEDPEREPMPEHVAPMLATTGELPRDEQGWAFEIKWDGVRAIAYAQGGTLRLESRNGRDITPALPRAARARPRARRARGDPRRRGGRVRRRPPVVPEAPGPHAPDLRARGAPAGGVGSRDLHDLRPALPRRALADGPPYEERRAALLELGLTGPTWQTPAHHVGDGARLLEASEGAGARGDHRQAARLPVHARAARRAAG